MRRLKRVLVHPSFSLSFREEVKKMLYHAIGAVAALAVIALSYFALRALVRHAGLPSVWGQLGVMTAATVAAAMPLTQ